MDKKKFAVVTTTWNDNKYVHVHDVEEIKEWMHGHVTVIGRTLTPLAYLADGPDNPLEESTLDISYHIEFQEFIGELVEADTKTIKICDKTVSLTKTILDTALINSGVDKDLVVTNEYRLWHNDRGYFIECAYKGFKHSSVDNPVLTLIYDDEITASIFMRALMGDDNG